MYYGDVHQLVGHCLFPLDHWQIAHLQNFTCYQKVLHGLDGFSYKYREGGCFSAVKINLCCCLRLY